MARNAREAASSAEDDVNLTPMLDVVFILLIFFIVTIMLFYESGISPAIYRLSIKSNFIIF